MSDRKRREGKKAQRRKPTNPDVPPYFKQPTDSRLMSGEKWIASAPVDEPEPDWHVWTRKPLWTENETSQLINGLDPLNRLVPRDKTKKESEASDLLWRGIAAGELLPATPGITDRFLRPLDAVAYLRSKGFDVHPDCLAAVVALGPEPITPTKKAQRTAPENSKYSMAGREWSEVHFKRIDDNTVEVWWVGMPGPRHRITPEILALIDKRDGTPNTAWALLIGLLKTQGIKRPQRNPKPVGNGLPGGRIVIDAKREAVERDNLRKHIERLAKALQRTFVIPDYPFQNASGVGDDDTLEPKFFPELATQ